MKFLLDSIFSYHYHLGSVFSNFECTTHELIYFISGEGEIICNHGKIAYKANHIHFSKKGDIKSATCFKKTSYICLRFFGEIESTGIISGVFPCSDDELLKIFLDIQKEYRQQKSDYYELCNIKLVELIIKFSRSLNVPIEDERIYALINKLNSEKIFNMSVEEMAKISTYSYDSFRHRFKKITGKSPTDYLIEKRIEHACLLLNESSSNCTEIALTCGFSSAAQFSAIFKAKTGTNPKNYRK